MPATTQRQDFVALLYTAADGLVAELTARLAEAGYGDIRQTHGCVFGNIAPDGMRLTELAELAGMTKQGVGEAVSDLERLGYAERVADPSDGRAKIIRLTERGRAAQRRWYHRSCGRSDWYDLRVRVNDGQRQQPVHEGASLRHLAVRG